MELGSWYRAQLVTKGFHQRLGVDYHDTFSPTLDAKLVQTPLPTSSLLSLQSGTALSNPSEFRAIRTTEDWAFVKRLLKYLCGTYHHGLQLYHDSPTSLLAFSNTGWARNINNFSSTSAYIVYLGRNPIS
ncbi:hypothetical protein CXB51_017204 [Gossypium anomalum]|uniref:Reverse transcriptase Ty1/copia-type domain-containing protein n=1 Tax=Gossypium anomalum TaxID=47600 RepID=A0A8J5YS54_9ROSI|nr:hypothetical protein CXB51_017204 [Gossypium anomalum]